MLSPSHKPLWQGNHNLPAPHPTWLLHSWAWAPLELGPSSYPHHISRMRLLYRTSASSSLLPIAQKPSPLYSFNEFQNNWFSYPNIFLFMVQFVAWILHAFHSQWFINKEIINSTSFTPKACQKSAFFSFFPPSGQYRKICKWKCMRRQSHEIFLENDRNVL